MALLARPPGAEQIEQRGRDRHHLIRVDQHRQVPRQVRVLSLGAGHQHLEQHLAPDPVGQEAQVLRPEVHRVPGRPVQADVELARQVGVLAAVDEQRRDVPAEPARVDQLVREQPAERVGEHVADVVVAGLLGGQPDRGQPLGDLRHMLDAEPLHLEVRAGGDVDDAVAVLVGDRRDLARLSGGQLPRRDPDPVHVAARLVALAVEEAVPLHALQIGRLDPAHRRARLGVTQHVGPDVEAVLLRFPDFRRIDHRPLPSIRRPRRVPPPRRRARPARSARAASSAVRASISVSLSKRTAKARNAVTVTSAPMTRNAVGHGMAPPEQESGGDRTGVAARADDARHRTQRLLVDERHHRIGRALGHLHEQAEDDERGDGQRQHRHLREEHQGQPLEKERDEEPAHAPGEPPAASEHVAERAAEGAREDVHQAEEHRRRAPPTGPPAPRSSTRRNRSSR